MTCVGPTGTGFGGRQGPAAQSPQPMLSKKMVPLIFHRFCCARCRSASPGGKKIIRRRDLAHAPPPSFSDKHDAAAYQGMGTVPRRWGRTPMPLFSFGRPLYWNSHLGPAQPPRLVSILPDSNTARQHYEIATQSDPQMWMPGMNWVWFAASRPPIVRRGFDALNHAAALQPTTRRPADMRDALTMSKRRRRPK